MTDRTKPLSEAELESLFAASRETTPEMSGDLFAAILADAEQVQSEALVPAVPPPTSRSFGLRGLWQVLGGAPGFAGLAAVGLVGVGVGLNPPDVLALLADGYLGVSDAYVFDLVPDIEGGLIDG